MRKLVPRLRITTYSIKSISDFSYKSISKVWLLIFIIFKGIIKFNYSGI